MLIADTTSLEDANRLEILSFKWTINGSTTFFWKVVMSSGEISIPAVFSRFQLRLTTRAPSLQLVKLCHPVHKGWNRLS